eukprot:CAMPEP_0170458244 /NCGR_PEP_ID=MMETSP0123-20130129/5266_1 /TAXON_ID=182087 /ORGANISM="Favella ehrenbergii, Strain Fehren 1" /LENGTH=124 /DNA_ID=CAMNT_0010722303 /DNA_START=8 /DNA_END=382 /DNA_ORIENTATION=-
MTYKKKENFGTSIGGCFSLAAKIGIFAYVTIMFIAFFGSAEYDAQRVDLYYTLKDPEVFKMSPIDVVPIILFQSNGGSIMNSLYQIDYWLIKYTEDIATDEYEVIEKRPAIDCQTYSDKYLDND